MGTSEVQLRIDNSGVPGNLIDSSTNYQGMAVSNDSCLRYGPMFHFATPINLIAGQRYWLVKHATNAVAVQYQSSNGLGLDMHGEAALRSTDGVTWDTPCFRNSVGTYQAGCSTLFSVH